MPLTPETWRNQFTVNATTAGNQNDPDIIQLANGNILVSWTTDNASGLGSPTGTEVFAQIFDPLGNAIGGQIRLNNASTLDDEQNADLAALPNGGFVVVYHDVDNPANGGASVIRLEEYDASGNPVSDNPLVVNDTASPADPDYFSPRVAVSSATSVLIVYEERSGGDSAIVGKIYNPTTNTYSAQLTFMIGGVTGGTRIPDVAALTNGSYVIVANRGDADNSLTYRVVDSSGAGGASTFVTGTSSNTENDREASVTALTGGGFVISWTNTDANDTDIHFRVYDNAGTQTGSGFAGSAGSTENNNESKVIALADGTFVIAWDNDANIGVGIEHFSATGSALGSVFTVSADNADSLSGVRLADGRVALVWDVSGGEVSMEILDTRDNPNSPGVYSPEQWVVGTIGGDTFTAASNAEVVHGWDANDFITEAAGAGVNQIFGDAGNDSLLVTSSIGSDSWDGGPGTDTINWSASPEVGGVYDLLAGTATNSGGGSTETMVNFENFVGTDNRDIVLGNGGANILKGGGGDDSFRGRGGDDSIVGDAGDDTAIFGGLRSQYTVRHIAGTSDIRVTDLRPGSPDGVDTLFSVENTTFSDGTFLANGAANVRHDFNANGRGDILFQHDNGAIGIWLLNGTDIEQYSPAIPHPGAGWHARDAGDFNGDGKADVLWQHDNGTPAVWLFSDFAPTVIGPALAGSAPEWHIIAAGDFNGDTKSDILYQHDNGAIGIWAMDGVNVAQYSPAIPHPGDGWHAKDAADFNGDGKADIVWQHDNGTPAVWLFDGFSPTTFGPALPNPGPEWDILATGDFNDDHKADIVFQHDNGALGIWLMDGVNVLSFSPAIPHPGAGWHVKDATDTDGDGKADIIWQHDNGTPAVWLFDGITPTSFGPALPGSAPEWHII